VLVTYNEQEVKVLFYLSVTSVYLPTWCVY